MPNNDPSSESDPLWEEVLDIIRHTGWVVQSTLGNTFQPPYAYTVGLTAKGLPELLMIGQTPGDSLRMINGCAKVMIDGEVTVVDRRLINNLEATPLALRADDRGKTMLELMRTTRMWAAENKLNPKAMQILTPDPMGKFPWDADCNPSFFEKQDPSALLRIEHMRQDEVLNGVAYPTMRLQ